MYDSLTDLENRRSAVLAEISALGDFRPGSISATQGRCGNRNCHCHKPDDPGHGPNLRLTYKAGGKTVTARGWQRRVIGHCNASRGGPRLVALHVDFLCLAARVGNVVGILHPHERLHIDAEGFFEAQGHRA